MVTEKRKEVTDGRYILKEELRELNGSLNIECKRESYMTDFSRLDARKVETILSKSTVSQKNIFFLLISIFS